MNLYNDYHIRIHFTKNGLCYLQSIYRFMDPSSMYIKIMGDRYSYGEQND